MAPQIADDRLISPAGALQPRRARADDRVVIITALLVLVVCLATLSHLLGRALSTATTALVRSAYKHVRHVR